MTSLALLGTKNEGWMDTVIVADAPLAGVLRAMIGIAWPSAVKSAAEGVVSADV